MAGLSLQKGQSLSLTKAAPSMAHANVGLSWDVNKFAGSDFDLDASAILLDASGKVPSDAYFIFFNQPASPDGSVKSLGDNRTGAGEGDDETIQVDLADVPANIEKIEIVVSIYDAANRGQNFGGVENAAVRVYDADTSEEIARYDLTEDYSVETALVFGELYRHNGEWKFKAIGQGFADGLEGIAREYGVNV